MMGSGLAGDDGSSKENPLWLADSGGMQVIIVLERQQGVSL